MRACKPFKLFVALLMSGLGLIACTKTPDLLPVEVSFESGTLGSRAIQPSNALTRSNFGKRVQAAVRNNPALAQSKTQMQIAQADQDVARGAFLPQVSLGLNTRSEPARTNFGEVSPYLRVSQLVYDGGVASGDLAAARARVFESRGSQLQSVSATTMAAVEAYKVVLDQRALLEVARRNVAEHVELQTQIFDRVASGAGSNADALTARSRTADARTRLADAQARLDRSEARYQEVFGLRPDALSAVIAAPALQRSDMQIVLDSPQVRRADAALVAARAEYAAAQARRKPEVRASAFAVQEDFDDSDFGVDLVVNYELDSTGQRRASIAAASARVQQATGDRDALVREIRRELGFIRSDQKAGADRLQQARLAVQANAESVSAARAQFLIGRRSLIEILDAQRDYVNAQEVLILAEQEFFLTNYAALALTGDILDLFDLSLNTWEGSR